MACVKAFLSSTDVLIRFQEWSAFTPEGSKCSMSRLERFIWVALIGLVVILKKDRFCSSFNLRIVILTVMVDVGI